MHQTFCRLLVFIALTYGMSLPISAQSKIDADISVCSLRIPDSLKQANANFNVSYSFVLDKLGVPTKVSKLQDNYVGKQEVLSCLADWRIRGLADGKKLFATFKWRHGKGWVEVLIVGLDFTYAIRIKEGIGY